MRSGNRYRLYRHPLLLITLASTLTLAAEMGPASIERYSSEPATRILESVQLPPGTQTLILSGVVADRQVGRTGENVEDYGDTQTQSLSALRKIEERLRKHGYVLGDLVKLTVFLTGDPGVGGKLDFEGFNRAFDQFFRVRDNPNTVARTTVQVVALASPSLLVEIEATAARVPRNAKSGR